MKNTFRWMPLGIVLVATTVTLGGCKLSDLVDDDRQTVLQGYVADQHGPLTGAKVEIRDADGVQFRAFTNGSGQFSLAVDWKDISEDEGYEITHLSEPVMLRVLHNGEGDGSYYYSVLCNVVYDDRRDQVNVNNITDHVLREVQEPSDDSDDWHNVADNYCGENFADTFNETATALETDFNFFNGPASGFGNLLRDFDAGSLDADGKPVQQIKNSVGSLSAYPSSGWEVAYEGTVDGEPVGPESINIGSLSTSPLAAVGALLAELYAEIPSHIDLDDVLEITALNIASDGLGEVGTEVSIALKGKVSYLGFSSRFDLVITLNGVDGPV